MKKLHDIDDYHGMTPRDSRDIFHHRLYVEKDLGPAILGYLLGLTVVGALLLLFLVIPSIVHAGQPILVDPSTGRYLGNVNNNRLDPNSISNPVGRYGSVVSPDSINNPVGRYGSPTSSESVHNPYASHGRIISPVWCPPNLNPALCAK